MGRQTADNHQDRYLHQRHRWCHYKRNVPQSVAHLDERAPRIRISLKTKDLAVARAKRDAIEAADDALWSSMLLEQPQDSARARYAAAMRRVEALGFSCRTSDQLAQSAFLDNILDRLESFVPERTPLATAEALAGVVQAPPVTVSKAFEIYCDEIVPHEHLNKSAVQKTQWKKVKQRAVNNFIAISDDKAMGDISRDDAMRLYRHWLDRIAPKEGRATHSASSGNRDIGNMRVLYEAYFRHFGEEDRKNPFSGLGFSLKKKRSRPPFPGDWIIGTIMKPGALTGLNDEARGLALALIETGARPSELANLQRRRSPRTTPMSPFRMRATCSTSEGRRRFGSHVGMPIRIKSLDRANSQLTLAYKWPGPSQTTAPYEISFNPYILTYRQAIRTILGLLKSGNVAALAELIGEADTMPYFAGPGQMGRTGLTEAARALLALAGGDGKFIAYTANNGTEARVGGKIHLTLFLPHDPNALKSIRLPQPITITADGPVTLPGGDNVEA